jgi:hypothetical protein
MVAFAGLVVTVSCAKQKFVKQNIASRSWSFFIITGFDYLLKTQKKKGILQNR